LSVVEKPVTFGPGAGLVGIWCEPQSSAGRVPLPAVVLVNSGVIHRAGVGRLHVRLARAMAELGFASLRFDLSGIGDSARPRDAAALEEIVARDVDAAVAWAKNRSGVDSAILMGLCTGARDALDHALKDRSVAGVVAIDVVANLRNWQFWVVHYGRRFFRLRSWMNAMGGRNRRVANVLRQVASGMQNGNGRPAGSRPLVLGIRPHLAKDALGDHIRDLLDGGTRLLFAFAAGEGGPYNHRRQMAELYPDLTARRGFSWEFFPEADHIFSERDQQARLIVRITEWLAAEFPKGSRVPRVEGPPTQVRS